MKVFVAVTFFVNFAIAFVHDRVPVASQSDNESCKVNFSGKWKGQCVMGEVSNPVTLELSQLNCDQILHEGSIYRIPGQHTRTSSWISGGELNQMIFKKNLKWSNNGEILFMYSSSEFNLMSSGMVATQVKLQNNQLIIENNSQTETELCTYDPVN